MQSFHAVLVAVKSHKRQKSSRRLLKARLQALLVLVAWREFWDLVRSVSFAKAH